MDMKAGAKIIAAGAGLISGLFVCGTCKVALGEPSQSSGDWISPSSIGPSPGQSTPSADYVRKPTDPPAFDPGTPPAIDPSEVKVSPLVGDEPKAEAPR